MNDLKIEHSKLIGTFEEKQAIVEQFNLMDDNFFSVVMKNKAACEYMLTVLLGKPIKVLDNRTQYVIRNLPAHSAELDALIEDDEGHIYDVEIQVENNDDHPKRVRFYQAAIDWSMLEKGRKYQDLPDLYLLFISKFDMWKQGKTKYEIKRTINDTSDVADNGVHEIYYNTVSDEDSQLTEMLHYFNNSDADDRRFGALSDAVNHQKRTKQGVDSMCKAVEEYAKEMAIVAKVKGVLKMLEKNISLSDALEILELDEKTYNEYVNSELLKEAN